MEAFALLWVGKGGCQRAVGKRRQLQVLAKQGRGALLHYHHLPEEQQQTIMVRGFFASKDFYLGYSCDLKSFWVPKQNIKSWY